MVLHLYASPISTCSKRVAMILHEKKIPFVFHSIDLSKGENKAPEFVKHQPFGQVPYIDDDGFILFESRAIARFLATKHADQGTPLVPTGLQALAKFDEAASIETSHFDSHASKAIFEAYFKKVKPGLTPDQAAADVQIAALKGKLQVYDQILGKTKYLAGDEITAVDLYHIPYGALLPLVGCNLLEDSSTPNVARWWNDITSRPSWQAVKDGIKGVDSY